MARTNWLSWLKNRSHSQKYAPRRRQTSMLLGGVRDWLLEDRCLLSAALTPSPNLNVIDQTKIYVAGANNGLPYTLTNAAAGAGKVIYLGGSSNTDGFNFGTVPQKLVTFTNDSSNKQTIYPFLYSPNAEAKYDPADQANDEYRLYIGYQQGGKNILGLPYGQSVTINVPLVFWNGGRADIATDGPNLIPKSNQSGVPNPFQFTYKASTYITAQGVTSSSDNGILLYYKANTVDAPVNPSPASQGQLTEWTIRDKDFLTTVNSYDGSHKLGTIPASELTTLINYDVSYVDDMLAPVAMTATNVPIPIQYIQGQSSAVQNGNTTTITLPTNPQGYAGLTQLLTQTYPYTKYTWQVLYNVVSPTIELGQVTGFSNGKVTVKWTQSGSVSKLPAGANSFVFYTNAVTQDYGWTGANNDIVAMQDTMKNFTTNNPKGQNVNGLGQYFATTNNPAGLGWPQYYNPNGNALLKIPSGASILINSPLTDQRSPYAQGFYSLTSNGAFQIQYGANITSSTQNLTPGVTAVFNVVYSPDFTPADLQAMKNANVKWNIFFNTQPFGTIQSIDTTKGTITVLMNNTIKYNSSGYAADFRAPISDPYVTKLTNLWYSWAQYYVNQFSGPKSVTIQAAVSAQTFPVNEPTDTRILTLDQANWAKFGAAGPQLGMLLQGIQFNGQNITILKTDPSKYQIYLSAPVPSSTTSFTFLAPQAIAYNNDKGLQTNLIDPKGFSKTPYGDITSFAYSFAETAYEMVNVYSTTSKAQLQATKLPNLSMAVVYEAIGGNVGFLPTAAFSNISADVRDLGKSALRGVPDFNVYPNTYTKDANWKPGAWYPPPSTSLDNQNYNVFNLDPFVWFVHQQLELSGYGFSFDDDAADIGAGGASTLTVTYASGASKLPLAKQWYPSTPWGNVTTMATITAGTGKYANNSILTIQPQDVKAFWQVSADDKNNGVVGAYVSTTAKGITIPPGTNLLTKLDSNQLQIVLSGKATTTTKPISVTFTGYPPPKTLSSNLPPAPSPHLPLPPPPHHSSGSQNTSSSNPSTSQEIASLVANEALLTLEQVFASIDAALGLPTNPTLASSIVAHQNALIANPFDHTLLGQLLLQFIEFEVLKYLESLL